ncbi:NADH-ubiquinone/plastoquinone oxidoreductase, chain 3 [Thermosinus carboxydivorans Nor1]|uniref:NADH-quinone oxidoreductase subunit A n=1 Tax=Thermosinus carboxydivorans Nor1 TaxID=401526 RepID=A1HPT1_9FIRM|nr:NADH-quinone oxidoreductase subunit A [Thermosinus carboxydivorans]EAX48050.1 NADH-ubiquinone/plastoquinone oxidoreductase, chain 3 [Thermosinus carboxydivorans Nor1]
MLTDYGRIGLLMVVALIFPFIPLFVSSLLQTKKPTTEKLSTYECGLDTIGRTWIQFKSSYFLYALVFVVFDIETVFLYPWAVKYQQLGTYAFVEMFIFIAILVIGLWYAWKKGALEWK